MGLYARYLCSRDALGRQAKRARDDRVSCIQDICIQDTLSSRAALGLPLGRVRRASKGILHTNKIWASFDDPNLRIWYLRVA